MSLITRYIAPFHPIQRLHSIVIRLSIAFLIVISLFGLSDPVTKKTENSVQARPLSVGQPSIGLDVPSEAFLGEDVTFTVSFSNPDTVEGYGPFVDILLDTTGADGLLNPDGSVASDLDGLGGSSISVNYAGTSINASDIFVLTFDSTGTVEHPLLKDHNGDPVIVTAPTDFTAGDTLLVVRLPFGSFVPGQPAVELEITADMSSYADLGTPLTIAARGGYQFGSTAIDDWCCDDQVSTLSPFQTSSVTPILLTLTKTNTAPEDERVSGPNFQTTYTIEIEIAPGQTITNLDIVDTLPENAQFVGPVSLSTAGSCTTPDLSTPGGIVDCTLTSITGPTIATLSFPIYIPLTYYPSPSYSATAVIPASTGDDVSLCNNASAVGDWYPLDPRDSGSTDNAAAGSDTAPCENILEGKSIAIQKTGAQVANVGSTSISPGDTIRYTLDFQVSDYFAFDDVILTDVISDGLRLDTSYTPTMTIEGNSFELTSSSLSSSNYDIYCNYSGAPAAAPGTACTIDTLPAFVDPSGPAAEAGSTTLIFYVTNEIITRGQQGTLVGGCIEPGGSGSYLPNCDTTDPDGYNDGPVTGTLTFQALVQENFSDDYPSGDPSVDQGDILTNDAQIEGQLLSTADLSTTGMDTEADTTQVEISLERGTFAKSVYAINGEEPVAVNRITVGDEVTYRLTYDLVTADVEDLSFTDYFPLPIFDVDDADANGTGGTGSPNPTWTFDDTKSTGVTDAPPSGVVKLGPMDDFYSYSNITPSLSVDSANNSVGILYGDFNGIEHTSKTVDLLLTVTVTDKPFADELYLTNQAEVHEGSTNATTQVEDALIQVLFTSPALVTTKSVVYTDGLGALSPTQPGPAGITWLDPGSSPRWTGVISSTGLASSPVDSDLNGADAGDLVTFAIVIENQGTGIYGAFDLIIRDTPPGVYEYPTLGDGNSINLQVYYGSGDGPIAYTDTSGAAVTDAAAALFGSGIELVDGTEGVCASVNSSLNNNVIVITYDMRISESAVAGETYENEGTLVNYAGQEGGTDFAEPDQIDNASVTLREPVAAKSLIATDQTFTSGSDVTIGEIATYQVTVTLPEGTLETAQITDTMDAGLAFVGVTGVTYSGSVTVEHSIAVGTAPTYVTVSDSGTGTGNQVIFDFGTITNSDTDDAVSETLTVEYQAVALNVTGNQAGTSLANLAELTWTPGDHSVGAGSVSLTVVEPTLTISKTVQRLTPIGVPATSRPDAGDTLQYTITLSNSSGVDAFDASILDTLPTWLDYSTLALISVTDSGGVLGLSDFSVDTSSGILSTLSSFDMPVGRVLTLGVQGVIRTDIQPNQEISNTAEADWTSLDGEPGARSIHNSSSVERTGDDGPGGVLNDYAVEGSVSVSTIQISGTKYLVNSSEAGTSGTELTIGEIVRFRLAVDIPEGVLPSLILRDSLPTGMMFINDGTSRVVFVSNSGITSTTLSGAGLNFTGSAADLSSLDTSSVVVTLPDEAVSSNQSTNEDIYTQGTPVYFSLGDVTNTGDNDADSEYVVVEFNALVTNLITNQGRNNATGAVITTTRTNQSNAYYTYSGGSTTNITLGTSSITITEPAIANLTKTVSPTQAEAGNEITYTVTFSDVGSPAYDVVFTDTLPDATKMTLEAGTLTVSSSGNCATISTAPVIVGNDISVPLDVVPAGCAVTIEYKAILETPVEPDETLDNAARVTYTSLPGSLGTLSNDTGSSLNGIENAPGTDNGERTGETASTLNDYIDTAVASLTVNPIAPVKSLVNTTDPLTLGTDLTIGETARFRMEVMLAQGTSPDFILQDNLPDGFAYLDNGNTTVALVSNDSDDTCATSTQTLTSSTLSGSTYWVCGNETSLSSITPTGALTSGDITGGPFTDGTDPIFHLGNLVNLDIDTDQEFIVLEFDAQLLNVIGNQDGDSLTNTFSVSIAGSNKGDSNEVTLDVVEPKITTTKSVSLASGSTVYQAGAVLQFDLTFTNTGNSPAHEVTLRDDLPGYLVYEDSSLTCLLNSISTPADVTVQPDALLVTISGGSGWDIPVSGVLSCTYRASLSTSVLIDGTYTNTADADWSSYTGSDNTEDRIYDGGTYVNDTGTDYNVDGDQDTDSVDYTIDAPELEKTIDQTQAAIGETVTYTISIATPLGTFDNLTLHDDLPAGLIYAGNIQYTGFSPVPADPAVPAVNDGSTANSLDWDFGTVEITQSPASVSFDGIVANLIDNQDGDVLTYSVRMVYADASHTDQTLDDSVDLTIIEPVLTLDKSYDASGEPYEAGDIVPYTLVIQNTSSVDAYDVVITDLPAGTISTPVVTASSAASTVNTVVSPVSGLTVTVDQLPAGESITVQYNLTVPDSVGMGSSVINTGHLTWTSQPGTNGNERSGDGTPLNDYQAEDSAQFSITLPTFSKTVDKTSATIGETAVYTLTIESPNGTIHNMSLHDDLPSGVYLDGTPTYNWTTSPTFTAGTGDPQTLDWSFGEVVVTSSPLTIEVPVVVANQPGNQAGITLTNNAAFTYEDGSYSPHSLTGTADIALVEPVVTITKIISNPTPALDEVVDFTITLSHDPTSSTAYNLVVTDLIPDGLDYVSGSIHTVCPGTASGDATGAPQLSWTIDTLGSGQVCTLTYQARIAMDVSLSGALSNLANLTWTSLPGTPVQERTGADGIGGALNDYAGQSIVSFTPTGIDLSITKDDGVDEAEPGDTLTYTIEYANVGNQTADNVLITDTLPEGVSIVDSVPPVWTCDTNSRECTFSVGSLAPGASGTITLTVLVSNPIPIHVNEIYNHVEIESVGYTGSEPLDNNQDDDTDTLNSQPDLQIFKASDQTVYSAGGIIQYTITYANVGDHNTSGVVITETVPEHTTFYPDQSDPDWECTGSTCTLEIDEVDVLPSGTAPASVLFAVIIDDPIDAGVETVDNAVTIHDDGTNGEDKNPDDNSDDLTVDVDAAIDMQVVKDDGLTLVAPGSSLTYTITVTNAGTQNATGIEVVDTLPEGVTFVAVSNDGVYDATLRTITWKFTELAGHASLSLTLQVTVDDPYEPATSEITNTVTVKDDGTNGPEPTPDDNEDSDTDLVSQMGKTVTATNQDFTDDLNVAIGEIATYQVTLNLAPGQVAELSLVDTLDQGMAFVGCDAITVEPTGSVTLETGLSLDGICQSAVVTRYPADSLLALDDGRQMTMTFGDVTNTTTELVSLSVTYDVVILNAAVNRAGDDLSNQATWTWTGGSLSYQAGPLNVVEPAFHLKKSVDPLSAMNGSTVTYTLEIEPLEGGNKLADAFNLNLTDTVPAVLSYQTGSLTFVSGLQPDRISDLGAPTLRIGWDTYPKDAGKTIFTYQAVILGATPGTEVTNTAELTWSSLPGTITTPQSPYNTNSIERSYHPDSDVDIYETESSVDLEIPSLPSTGFAPGVVTVLPSQTEDYAYDQLGQLSVSIPALGVDLPIVGVPLSEHGWDLTWLGNQVGYLEGTAYPTWEGNTGLTAHVYDANGLPGPFVNLNQLVWGDQILVREGGYIYTYEVRSVNRVRPNDLSPLRHSDYATLTLITCQGYDEEQDDYTWRVVVQAVLISEVQSK